jgi:hypothetical protein
MENLDLGDQLEDFMICYDDTSNKSTNTWKMGRELHEDKETSLSNSNNKFDNRYQVLIIVGDNSEELDDNNNLVLNPANLLYLYRNPPLPHFRASSSRHVIVILHPSSRIHK